MEVSGERFSLHLSRAALNPKYLMFLMGINSHTVPRPNAFLASIGTKKSTYAVCYISNEDGIQKP